MFNNLLTKIYKQGENTDSALIILGAIGWLVSMFAQLTAISTNEKISDKDKKFLLAQETSDGLVNTGLYLGLTTICSKLVKKAVTNGSIITKEADDILKEIKPYVNGLREKEIYKLIKVPTEELTKKYGDVVAKAVENLDTCAKKNSKSCGLVATIAASIISCNILTPIARNMIGAHKANKMKVQEAIDKPCSDTKLTLTPPVYKPSTFTSFTNITKI